MFKSLKFYFISTAALVGVFVLASSLTPASEATFRDLAIPGVSPDKDYWLAGERVPVENFDVRERFERELIVNTFRHSYTIMILKHSSRYFPVIEPILKEHGIPDDFKYLAVAESNLQNATSSAGARGIWQFMKGTAGDYALEINDDVDERYHLEKSTRAACAYLAQLKARFGSWTLAAAAYNMGPTALRKELESQRSGSYYDLNLSEETNRYVFRVLAFKEVMLFPEKYGFVLPEAQRYPALSNYAVARVDSTIVNLGDFAKEFGVSYRMLKVYNPWLRDKSLSNEKGKVYEIQIPKGK